MTDTIQSEPVVSTRWQRSWAKLPIEEKIRYKSVQLANLDDPETRHIMRCLSWAQHEGVRARSVRVRAVSYCMARRVTV